MTIVEAMRDPVLFGRFFGPSWSAWVVVLKAVFGIAMTELYNAIAVNQAFRIGNLSNLVTL